MYRSLIRPRVDVSMCRQSPINIQLNETIYDPEKCQKSSIKLSYHPGDCHEVVVLPHTWMLRTADKCRTTLTASHLPSTFCLLQVHGHWGEGSDCGSEHSIDRKRYAGEVHFVFWNSNYSLEEATNHSDGMAVIAVFLVEGKYSHDYGHITGSILEAKSSMEPVAVPSSFDLNKLLPRGSDYVFYEGSLTTPPYTECVLWTVMLRPMEVSVNQIRQFRRVGIPENCRSVQSTGARHVYSSCQL